MKVYINGPGHMTNMAKTFSYKSNCPIILKVDMEHYVLMLFKVYINDDPRLTLTCFTTMSNIANIVLETCTYSMPRY